jgi:hypothetical protein
MFANADVPWALLAEASVEYVGERAIDLELAPGVRIRYAPTEGLTKSDYDFFGIEGWDDELLTTAPSTTLPSVKSTWFHNKSERPPAEFRYGPLAGTQRELAARICPGVRVDTRRLQRKSALGASIWTRKQHRKLYEVWFRHERDYLKATGQPILVSPP